MELTLMRIAPPVGGAAGDAEEGGSRREKSICAEPPVQELTTKAAPMMRPAAGPGRRIIYSPL